MAVHVADDVLDPKVRERCRLALRLVLGQASGIVCIAFLTQDKKFHEEFYDWPSQEALLLHSVEEKITTHNIYFCPQLLMERKRVKGNVQWTPSAWADLDTCSPDNVFVDPTVIMETSPGRYQAFWVMEKEYDPDDMEDLSRRIAYKHAEQGADRSGWDLTQLMRMPYTYNFKYAATSREIPVVKVLEFNRNKYRLEDFKAAYPATPSYSTVDIPMPEIDIVDGRADELLQERRQIINPLIWSLCTDIPPPDVSWSEILWRLVMLLFEAGFARDEVYIIATNAACNKYARDGRPAQQLWKEVCRAEAKQEMHQRLLVPTPEDFIPLLTPSETELVEKAPPLFVERYMEWASKLGDAAPQYHQAGAFVVLSSLLAGSVNLPTSYGTIVPNIWFMILADTTLTRKTTSMDIATDLILEVDDNAIMATDGSIEGLLNSLAIRPGSPSIFLRDEFSGLLEQMTKKDYMAGMPELLTKLYDGKMQKRVLRKETIEVRDPRLIIFAGGIKNKVTGLLSYDMVSSGFMPRFVFITAESDLGRVKPIGPPTTRSLGNRDAILEEMRSISRHYNRTEQLVVDGSNQIIIPHKVISSATMGEEAWIRYNKLENDLLDRGLKSDKPDVMTPVGDRLAKSMLKAALLIAASRQRPEAGDLVIEELDILRAIRYGEQWWMHGEKVMESVGKGQAERQLDTILNAIIKHPQGILRSYLMQAYHLSARDASSIFETLEQRGLISRRKVGKGEVLEPTTYLIRKVQNDERERDRKK